jgi:hypothetical protein
MSCSAQSRCRTYINVILCPGRCCKRLHLLSYGVSPVPLTPECALPRVQPTERHRTSMEQPFTLTNIYLRMRAS